MTVNNEPQAQKNPNNENVSITRYPKKIIASFQVGNCIGLMVNQLYAQQFPFYYQSVVGLDITLYMVAMMIYMVFNMFNDPLIGYLCDKSKKLTSKWGKRFPFIVMGGIPWCFLTIFVYMAPKVSQIGQIGVFFWMLIFLCLSDAVFSLYDVNRGALFPDKFRDNTDRRFAGMIVTIFETIGILLGVLIPVLIIESFGGEIGWSLMAIVIAILALVLFLFMIPGIREGPEMREHRDRLNKEVESVPFFEGIRVALKNRNFLAYLILYVCYTSTMGLIMGSIPFFVQDILQMSKIGEIILIFYVIAVLIAAPIWYKVSFKLGLKKVALLGACVLGSMGITFLLIPTGPAALPYTIAILLIAGSVDGALISMTGPIFSSAIDEATLKTGKRQEGLYNGTFLFFSRLGIAFQSIVFWIVRMVWNYHSGSTDPAELMGLRIQMSVFPLILIFTGIVVFWRLYTITPQQLEANAKKLQELDL